MIQVIVDIETEPLPAEQLEAFMPEIKASGVLKDPVKIAADIEDKKQKFYDQAALSALTASVCAIGVWEVGKKAPALYHTAQGKTEADLITVFSNLTISSLEHGRPEIEVITFNGHSFDVPFLCRRGLKYGRNMFPNFFNQDGSLDRSAPLVDLAAIWDCRRKDYISLNDMSMFLGTGSKPKSKELFWQMLKRDVAEAESYLTRDLELTLLNAQRMGLLR